MKQKLEDIQARYKGTFEIITAKGWVNVKAKTPTYTSHPAVGGPAFLDYSIEAEDNRPGATLEDRSRNVWLRDSNGKGIQHASYCGGMGIWQVSQEGIPQAFSDLNPGSQDMVKDWLKMMDEYILKKVPELKEYLE